MATIDERVLSMRFDNAQFINAIKTTLGYMEKLKTSLKIGNASTEFNKVEKAAKKVSFDDLYNAVDQVSNRFSTLGLIGTTALVNLSNTAINTGKKIVSNLLDPLIAGGKRRALNIEQAKFQIQGLGHAWEVVKEDVDYAVDGTAYGLDVAAKAASQLLASNVATGDSMKAALRGISGVAAMTSSEYEDIANVFTTVAGNGRLMASELNRISARGLNAAAALGTYLGVSEAEVREMTSQGKIDFNTFAAAMDSAFGEHAKKANDTFTGALSNMKAALSRIGAEFATPSYEALRNIFLSLTQVINGVKDSLKPVFDSFTEGTKIVTNFVSALLPVTSDNATRNKVASALAGPMEKVNTIMRSLAGGLTNIAKLISSIVVPIFETFSTALGGNLMDILVGAVNMFQEFTSRLVLTERVTGNLRNTFSNIFELVSSVVGVIAKLIAAIAKPLWSAITKTFGFLIDITLTLTSHITGILVKIKNFIREIYQLESVQYILSKFRDVLSFIREGLYSAYNAVREFVGAFLDNAFSLAGSALSFIANVIRGVVGVFDRLIIGVRDYIRYMQELPHVQEFIEKVKRVFEKVSEIVGNVVNGFKELITNTKQSVKEFTQLEAVQNIFNVLRSIIDTVKEGIYNAYLTIRDFTGSFVDSAFGIIVSIFTELARVVRKAKNAIKDFVKNIWDLPYIQEFVSKSAEAFNSFKESVGSAASTLRDKFVDAFRNARRVVSDFVSRIRDLTSEYVKLPTMQEIVENLQNFITKAFEKSKDIFEKVVEVLGDVFDRVKEVNEISFKTIITNLGNFKTAIIEIVQAAHPLETLKNIFVSIKDGAIGAMTGTGEALNAGKNQLADFIEWVKTKFANISMGDIIAAGVGVATIPFLIQFTNLIKSLDKLAGAAAGVVGSVKKITKSITELFTTMEKVVKAKANTMYMDSIANIFKSVAMLAAGVALLAAMDPKRVQSAAVALGVLSVALIAMVGIANKLAAGTDPKATIQSIGSLTSVAGSMLVLALALRLIGDMPIEQILAGVVGMGLVMVELGAFIIAVDKIAPQMEKSSISFLSLAASLILISIAMNKISNLDPISVITSLATIGLIIKFLSMAGKIEAASAETTAKQLLGVAIAMLVMVHAMKKIAELKPNELIAGMIGMIYLVSMIVALMVAMKHAGQYAASAGGAMILISVAMIIMVEAIKHMAKLDKSTLAQATTAITSIMVIFALLISATKLAGEHAAKAGLAIIMMSGSMMLMAAAIAVLSKLDKDGLERAQGAVMGIMLMYAVIIAATGYIKQADKTITMIAVSLGILAASLAILSLINPDNLMAASLALTMVMGMFGIIIASTGYANKAKTTLMVMLLVVGGLAAIILALSELDVKSVSGIATSLSDLLLSISISALLLSLVGQTSMSAIGGAAAMVAVVVAIAGILAALGGLIASIDGAKEFLENGIPVLETIATALGTFFGTIVSSFIGAASSGIVELGTNLSLFAQNFMPFLETMKQVDDSAIQGVQSLVTLITALAISDFINGVTSIMTLGGLLGGNSLQHLSDSLVPLGEALKAFGDSIDGANIDSIKSASEAAEALTKMFAELPTSGGIAGAIFGESDLGTFSNDLVTFGQAMKDYGDVVANVNNQAIINSLEGARGLVDLANTLPNTDGGLVGGIFGSGNLGDFADHVKSFGEGLVEYSKAVSGAGNVNKAAINNSIEASKGLVDIAVTLGNSNIQDFWTGNALSNFSDGIKDFGEGLVAYGDAIRGGSDQWNILNYDNIQKSVEASRGLAEVAGIIASANVTDFWTGNHLTNFGTGVEDFGEGLASYANAIGGENSINTALVESSINGAKGLAEIAQILSGLTIQDFWTGNKLEHFSDGVEDFGSGLRSYSDAISENGGLDTNAIDASINGARSLADIAKILSESDNTTIPQDFIDNLPEFGSALSTYSDNISSINMETILASIEPTTQLLNMLIITDLPLELNRVITNMSSFGNALKDYNDKITQCDFDTIQQSVDIIGKLRDAAANFQDVDLSGFKNFSTALKDMAGSNIKDMATTLTNQAGAVKEAGINLVNQLKDAMVQELTNIKPAIQASSEELMNGFADGIRFSQSTVKTEMISLMDSMKQTAFTYVGRFVDLGNNLVEGLVRGISQNAYKASNAVGDMVKAAYERGKEEADVNSPSRKFMELGKSCVEGLSLGLDRNSEMAERSSSGLVKGTMASFKNALDESMDLLTQSASFDPVITPVLDASMVERGIASLSDKFSNASSYLSLGATLSGTSYGLNSRFASGNPNNQNGTVVNNYNSYDFNQTNNSPKALPAVEIYRHTNRQIRQFKQMQRSGAV